MAARHQAWINRNSSFDNAATLDFWLLDLVFAVVVAILGCPERKMAVAGLWHAVIVQVDQSPLHSPNAGFSGNRYRFVDRMTPEQVRDTSGAFDWSLAEEDLVRLSALAAKPPQQGLTGTA